MGKLQTVAGRGFDLRHVLLGLGALTVLATVGLPAWFGRPGPTVDSAARVLAQDLRVVQNLAATEARQLWVRFEPDGYRMENEQGELIADPRTGRPFRRRWARDAIFRGVEYQGDETGQAGPLGFDPVGYSSRGATLRLGFGQAVRRIQVSPRQGLITILGGPGGYEDDGR